MGVCLCEEAAAGIIGRQEDERGVVGRGSGGGRVEDDVVLCFAVGGDGGFVGFGAETLGGPSSGGFVSMSDAVGGQRARGKKEGELDERPPRREEVHVVVVGEYVISSSSCWALE